MNNSTICGHCKKIGCRMFLENPHAVVIECGKYEETDLHKEIREAVQRHMEVENESYNKNV